MLSDIDEDGVYRLAAAVVKGLPDDERAEWDDVGRRIMQDRPRSSALLVARSIGRMDRTYALEDGRTESNRSRGRRSGSARISAKDQGRQ